MDLRTKYITALILLIGSIPLMFFNGWLGILSMALGFLFLFMGNSDADLEGEKTKEKIKEYFAELQKNHGFNPKKTYVVDNLSSVISIDLDKREVFVCTNTKATNTKYFNPFYDMYEFEHKFIPFDQIVEVQIYKNSQVVQKVSRGQQIGSIAVGSVLAGGVGAIIGGLSAESKQVEKINEMGLRFVLNDIENPLFDFHFFKADAPIKSDSEKYKQIERSVLEWYSVFEKIVLPEQRQN